MTKNDFQRKIKDAAEEATEPGGYAAPLLELVGDPQFSWSDKLWETEDGPASLMGYVYSFPEWSDGKLVERLLERGADINERDNDGRPLWYNTLSCYSTLELYLDRGVDPNLPCIDDYGNRYALPLMRAACADRTSRTDFAEIAGLLLKRGARIDTQDERGFTALHQAVLDGQFQVAHLLLEWGADPSILSGNDETPLDMLRRLHIAQENFARLEGGRTACEQQTIQEDFTRLEAAMESGTHQKMAGVETPISAVSGPRRARRGRM